MSRNKVALLHSKTRLFQLRLDQARSIITKAKDLDLVGYVPFSTGKDSTVVYHLVKEQYPNITGVWSDDEWFLPESLEYFERMAAKSDIRRIRTTAWHTDWLTTSGEWSGIPEYAKVNLNAGVVFLGLRQEENSYRRIHLRKFGSLFFAQSDDCWHCNPIHNWTWRDVWAYIVSFGLDYNEAYDRLEEIGVEPERQRIGPLAVERVLGYGQLAILKRGWPELFNEFAKKHPEAREYI